MIQDQIADPVGLTPLRIRNGDTNLTVWTAGEGIPVLMLHGFPDDHQVWLPQVSALVQAGFRVIAPDTRGCGDSDIVKGVSSYHVNHLVGDVECILDALGLEKVFVVGHDLGAVLGWHFVMQHPERCVRFVALSVGHPNAYAKAGWEQKRKSWYIFMFQLRGFAEWILKRKNWLYFKTISRDKQANLHRIERFSRPGRLTAALGFYRANLQLSLPRRMPRVQVPVLGVWSSADIALAEDQMVNSQAYLDAPFEYRRIDKVGHWMTTDAPEQVNALLLDYLCRDRADSATRR